jgi:hypothetical protein
MTLLEEIEHGAQGEEMPLGTLLRKCLVLVSRLGSQPAVDWVKWELNGYPKDVPVPDYRVLHLIIKANMSDIGRHVEGWVVPPAFLGKRADAWTRHEYRDGVGTIDHLLQNLEGNACFQMANLDLMLTSLKFTEMHIVSAWAEASSSSIKNILDTVRNRVLTFALDLGKEYPDAGAVKSTMPKEDAKKVDQMFISNIYGSANVVGTATNSNIVLNVTKGDFSTLKQTLEEHGVESADIAELKRAVEAEPQPHAEGFGPKVSAWLGTMMKKAAEGAWKVGVNVAGTVLGKAISRYYGLT